MEGYLFGMEGGSICFIKIIQDAGEGLSASGRSGAAGRSGCWLLRGRVSVSPIDLVCVGEDMWCSQA